MLPISIPGYHVLSRRFGSDEKGQPTSAPGRHPTRVRGSQRREKLSRFFADYGPFILQSPLGRGGTGDVWQGLCRAAGGTELAVAVKLLRSDANSNTGFFDSFERDVQAMAALDHPGIVEVLDYGRLGADAANVGEGRYPPGTPYIVMERLSGKTLKESLGKLSWLDLREILVAILSALAHAHARGVVHRDIKAGNVLLANPCKLTDFGIARLYDAPEGEDGDPNKRIYGTPDVIAPEQIERRWRDQGPWTDFYSLGCLTYALVSGRPPFRSSKTPIETLVAHLQDTPPPLVPVVDVPPGFDRWVERMMAKRPQDRFQRAAEARDALLYLDSPNDSRAPSSQQPVGEIVVPPTGWRDRGSAGNKNAVAGLGLGVFGLRTLSLVDRENERKTLWGALESVGAARRPRLIVLRGSSGSGKSRLARWLCERGHEMGLIEVLEARHSQPEGPLDGLGPMISRFLRCEGMERGPLLERLDELTQSEPDTPFDEAEALRELIRPATEDDWRSDESTIGFTTERERMVLLQRFLKRATRQRIGVLWLDDVQWGLEALGLVEHLLEAELEDLPLLVVATIQEEALAARTQERQLLQDVLSTSHAAELHVQPLSEADTSVLIRGLLGLAPSLAVRIEERCAGNPLFAVQLIGDWVQRGIVVPGEEGFVLALGSESSLPDDLHTVWADRIESLLHGRPPEDGAALELAAALGQEVEMSEWTSLCKASGCAASEGLLQALVRARLGHWGTKGRSWSFVHGMLRESLERRARDRGAWIAHNLACAKLIDARTKGKDSARLGRYLVEAQEYEKALDPLYQAAYSVFMAGSWRQAQLLLTERRAALEKLQLPPSDSRCLNHHILAGRISLKLGDGTAVLREATRAEQHAKAAGQESYRASAMVVRGRQLVINGDIEEARNILMEAAELFSAGGDRQGEAECWAAMGAVLRRTGELEAARKAFRRSMEPLGTSDDAFRRIRGFLGLVRVEVVSARFDRVAMLAPKGLEFATEKGFRFHAACFRNCLGEVARFAGDFSAAERHYRDALAGYETIGSIDAVVPKLNLAVLLLQQVKGAEARRLLEQLRAAPNLAEQRSTQALIRLGLAGCAAQQQRWAAVEEHFHVAQELLDETGLVDAEIAHLAELIARCSEDAGVDDCAKAARHLAREQWRALGNEERAREFDSR